MSGSTHFLELLSLWLPDYCFHESINRNHVFQTECVTELDQLDFWDQNKTLFVCFDQHLAE